MIPVRPYLTAYEMVGGARIDAENKEADTAYKEMAQYDMGLDMQKKRMEIDTMQQTKSYLDLADEEARKDFLAKLNPQGASPQTDPAAPAQVSQAPTVAPMQAAPQQETAQSFAIAPQAADNSQPLAPSIQSTGDFARYDRQAEAQPQAPTPQTVEVTGKRMTPEEKAAYDAANPPAPAAPQSPAAPVAQAAAPTQPQAPAAPSAQTSASALVAPQGAPAAKTPAEQLGLIRGTAIINGRVNPLSDSVNDSRIKAWEKLAAAGKVPPSFAAAQIEGINAGRAKQLKESLDLVEQVSKINDSDMTAREKELKIAVAIRGKQDDGFYAAYKVLQETGNPALATQAAKNNGALLDDGTPPDFSNPAHISEAKRRAVRSADYRTEQDESRKAEEASTKRVMGSNTNLPSGYRQTVVDGKVVTYDSDGNIVGQSAVTAADQAQRKSSATQVNVDTKGQGKLFEQLGKDDAERVGQYQAQAQAARGVYDRMGEIRILVTGPDGKPRTDLPLGTGQGLDMLAQRLGIKKEDVPARITAEAVKMNSAEAELVAAGRMKGQGSITDPERAMLRRAAAGDVANFTAGDWFLYTTAQQKLQAAQIEAANSKVDNVIKRNPDAAEKLESFRTEVPTSHLPKPAQGSKPSSASGNGSTPIVNSQAAYDALPSGTLFYDGNGKRGRKP